MTHLGSSQPFMMIPKASLSESLIFDFRSSASDNFLLSTLNNPVFSHFYS